MLRGSWTSPCNVISLLQMLLAGSNLNGQIYIHAYLCEKCLNDLEKHMFWNPILLNLQHYNHSPFSYNHIQVLQSLLWKTKFGVPFLSNFSTFRWKLQYYYCVACCFICQDTYTLLQNDDFIGILFSECLSRLLSGGGQGQYLQTNESNTVIAKEGVKKSFLENL